MGLNLQQLAAIQESCSYSIASLLEKRQDKFLKEVTKPMDEKFGFDQALKIIQNKPEIFEAINLSARYAGADANGRMHESIGDDKKYWDDRRKEYNEYTLDWLSLHAHIRQRTTIPQELKDRMLKAHPNFNLLHVAHMADYEDSLKKEIKEEETINDLVRLHEACLGMTPLTDVTAAGYDHLRHRLGRIPFNLDKFGETSTKPDEYREVINWLIETRIEERRGVRDWFIQAATVNQTIPQASNHSSEQEIVNLIEHMKKKHMLTEELIEELRNTNKTLEDVRMTLGNVRTENERIKLQKEALERKLSDLSHQVQRHPEVDDKSDNRTPLLSQGAQVKDFTCHKFAACLGVSGIVGITVGVVILLINRSSNDNNPPSEHGIVSFNYIIPWQNGGKFCIVNDDINPFTVNTYQFTLRGNITEIWGPAPPKTDSLFPYGSSLSATFNSDSTYTHTVVLPVSINVPTNDNYCAEFNIDPHSVIGPLTGISGFPPSKYPVIANGQTLPLNGKCKGSACLDPTMAFELSLDYLSTYSDDPKNPITIPTQYINSINYRVDFNASGILLPCYADNFLIPYLQKTQQQYPYLTNYIEVGSWGKGDDFTQIVSNTNTSATFIQNLVGGVRQAGFYGLTIKLDLISGKLPLNNEGIADFFGNLRTEADKAFGRLTIKVRVPGSRYGMNRLQNTTWERIAAMEPTVIVDTNLNGAYSPETNFQSPLEVDKNDPLYAQDPNLSIVGSLANYRKFFSWENMGPTVYMDGQCMEIDNLGPRQNGLWVPPTGNCGNIPYSAIATGSFPQVTCVSANDSPYNATMSSFCYNKDGKFFVTYTGIPDVQAIAGYYLTHPNFPLQFVTVTSTSGKWGDTIGTKGAREDLSLIVAIAKTANMTHLSRSNDVKHSVGLEESTNYWVKQIYLPSELRTKILEAAGKGILSTYLLELLSKGFLIKYLEERNYSKTQIFIIDQSIRALITLFALEGTLKNTLVTVASPIAVKILTTLGFSGTTANAVVTGGIMSASVYASPFTAIPTIVCSIPAAKLANYVADSAPMKFAYTKTTQAMGYLSETKPVAKAYQAAAFASYSLFSVKNRMSVLVSKVNPFAKKPNGAFTEQPLESIQCKR